MGWLGAVTRVATTAAVGNAAGRQKGREIEKEELRRALELEAGKRAEARAQERHDLDRRNTESTILSRGSDDARATADAETKARMLQIRARVLKRRPGYEGMTDEELQAIAADPEAFRHGMGLKPDPVANAAAIHRAKRAIDIATPAPSRARPGRPGAAAGKSLPVVQRQLDEARTELRGVESEQRPSVFRSPSDSVAFERRKQRAPQQRQRVDSLNAVRDSLADEVQGKPRGRSSSTPAPKTPLSSSPPLTAAQKARAQSDPEYRAFKQSQGYTF